LLPFPNPHEFVHKEGVRKDEFIKKLHERIKTQIHKKTEKYIRHNNKGEKEIVLRRETRFGFT